jgi:hypothetical protein
MDKSIHESCRYKSAIMEYNTPRATLNTIIMGSMTGASLLLLLYRQTQDAMTVQLAENTARIVVGLGSVLCRVPLSREGGAGEEEGGGWFLIMVIMMYQ